MEKHDLHNEFPEYDTLITQLKTNDKHFKNILDDYNQVNKTIHRLEVSEKYTDEELNSLRMKRVHLKDSISNILKSVEV